MSRQPSNPDLSKQNQGPSDPRSAEEKELDSMADEAAERAGKEEQSYDEQHDIFTK
ncbi:MAG: hypothetical protein WCC27_07470 [Acidobacteriaceae bacterium]